MLCGLAPGLPSSPGMGPEQKWVSYDSSGGSWKWNVAPDLLWLSGSVIWASEREERRERRCSSKKKQTKQTKQGHGTFGCEGNGWGRHAASSVLSVSLKLVPLTFTTFPWIAVARSASSFAFIYLHRGRERTVLPRSLGVLIFAAWMFSSNAVRNNNQKLWSKDCPMSLGSNITISSEMLCPWAWHFMLFLIWFHQRILPLSSPSHLSCSHDQVFLTELSFSPWPQPCYSLCLECPSSCSQAKVYLCHHIPATSLLQGVSQISGFRRFLLPNKEKKPSHDLHCINCEMWLMPSSREADGRAETQCVLLESHSQMEKELSLTPGAQNPQFTTLGNLLWWGTFSPHGKVSFCCH